MPATKCARSGPRRGTCPRRLVAVPSETGHEDAPLFHHYLDDPEETPAAALRTDIYFPVAEAMERSHPALLPQAAD
jgi:hypothetical protein